MGLSKNKIFYSRALGGSIGRLVMAGCLGAVVFLWCFGPKTMEWGSFDWLIRGDDHAQSLVGWLYFRTSSWGYPLGKIVGYNHPIGSSIAFNDTFPWFAVLLKILSPLLPARAQITGLWMLINFILQSIFGYLLLRAFNMKTYLAIIGTFFFAASPILVFRFDIGHASLCAHWCILAALYLAVKYQRESAPIVYWITLLLLAWSTHPYLGAMILPIALTNVGNTRRDILMRSGFMLFFSIIPVVMLGYFGSGTNQSEGGFHFFSADILGFFNPQNRSSVLSGPRKAGSYEGFAWLGSGVCFLLLYVIAKSSRADLSAIKKIKNSPLKPLIMICGLMAIFSLGSNVRLWGHWIISLEPLYEPLAVITGPFRSPGRFVWPLYYLVFAWVIQRVYVVSRSIPISVFFLLAGITLQIFDQINVISNQQRANSPADLAALPSTKWRNLGKNFKHLALVPPQYSADSCESSKSQYETTYYAKFAILAWDQRMSINSGPRARPPIAAEASYCKDFMDKIKRGQLDEDTVYIVAKQFIQPFNSWADGHSYCELVDAQTVCVSATRGLALASDYL